MQQILNPNFFGCFKNYTKMLLYDIGAILFLTGLTLLIRFAFSARQENDRRAHVGRLVICGLMEAVGGVLMIVAHYIVAGHSSFLGI